ncbi:MAG: hypothetical protein KIS62_12370 [Ramlibacter sp.]|nr:hypothetical protein [Ramlibacter sp.]MCW5650533.1 hypothetical protein [Ramlibacter sp.]
MTNDRIQQLLAHPNLEQMHSFIAALAMPGGAIAIADDAAWELIIGECRGYTDEVNGFVWYEVSPAQLRIELRGEDDLFQQVCNAVTYLAARGLLVSHPDNATLVRQIDPASPEVRG